MAVRLEITGLGIDDRAEASRRHRFEIHCTSEPNKADTVEFDGLVRSWYGVGVHGGFGPWLNSHSDLRHCAEPGGWRIAFTVDGIVTHLALAVFLRCLDETDIEMDFDRVVVDVQRGPPGAERPNVRQK